MLNSYTNSFELVTLLDFPEFLLESIPNLFFLPNTALQLRKLDAAVAPSISLFKNDTA